MPDYSLSKIYKIVVNTEEEYRPYVGATTQPLCQRFQGHKRTKSCSSRILFERFGVENCKIILIENYSCENKEELLKRERYWYDMIENCNLSRPIKTEEEIENRGKEQYQRTLEKNSNHCKEHYQRTLEKNPNYCKEHYQRTLELHPDYFKERYQKRLEKNPNYNQERYQKEKERKAQKQSV